MHLFSTGPGVSRRPPSGPHRSPPFCLGEQLLGVDGRVSFRRHSVVTCTGG
jgi:hypothetical protein